MAVLLPKSITQRPKKMILSLQSSKKSFDQPDYQMYVSIQNVLLMSCKRKDPQQKMNCSINGDISFA